MRSSTVKTTVLLAGNYERTKTLQLTAQDSGERWISGLNGQRAVLNANGGVLDAIALSAQDVVISGLKFSHYARNGILIQNSSQVRIEGNIIEDLRSTGWAQAAINVENTNQNISIVGNQITGANYDGIAVQNDEKTPFNRIYITDNVTSDTCRKVNDCGAIHLDDRSHSAREIRIERNIISNVGNLGIKARGIYLDDYVSNVIVRCNRIAGPADFAFVIHAGDHVDISNNVIDMTEIGSLMLYQQEPEQSGNFGMAENRFHDNAVIVNPARKDGLVHASLKAPNQPLVVFNNQWAKDARLPSQACNPTAPTGPR